MACSSEIHIGKSQVEQMETVNVTTPFLHVQDLAEIIAHFVDTDFGERAIYNIAEPETMNAETWVKRVAALLEVDFELIQGDIHATGVAARKYFPFRDYPCALNVGKFMQELNWKFRFCFDNGIEDTLSSYEFNQLKGSSPSSPDEIRILFDANNP